MTEKIISLLQLPSDKKARVMGIREEQTITIVSKQPFRGPLTVTVGGCHLTLGRGMAQKIIVKEL